MAATSVAVATASAPSTDEVTARVPPPASTAPTSGRYTAITRSSATSRDSTCGVSLFASHPRSSISLAAIPDDET